MKIILTPQETEKIFYNALCNVEGTGYMAGYGLELQFDRSQYKSSREHLQHLYDSGNRTDCICIEDVLMQILRDGGSLTYVDHEGDMTRSITLVDIHNRVPLAPYDTLYAFEKGNDDISDADTVLQTVLYEEAIFG